MATDQDKTRGGQRPPQEAQAEDRAPAGTEGGTANAPSTRGELGTSRMAGGNEDRGDDRRATQRGQRRRGGDEIGDDPASGTIDSPIAPGEAQAGDRSELGANLGGPIDVFPLRDRGRTERS